MCTGEEYFEDIGIWPGHGIDTSFVVIRGARPLSFVDLVMMGVRGGGVAGIGNLGVHRILLEFESTGAEGWDEFDATLIES